MTEYSPTDLATQLKSGLLSFPVTLFAAGGTGEGFSLTLEETDKVVRTAVEEVAGTVPVLADRNPTMIGFKDGVGSIEQMTRTYARVGDRLMYVGGLPTAETFALPLLQLGVSTYSSALFNFVPQWAIEFYDAVIAQDRDEVYRRLNEFVLPYLDIRDRTQGYAVSIVKGGLAAVGRPAGPVRPPLTDLREDEVAELKALVDRIS